MALLDLILGTFYIVGFAFILITLGNIEKYHEQVNSTLDKIEWRENLNG